MLSSGLTRSLYALILLVIILFLYVFAYPLISEYVDLIEAILVQSHHLYQYLLFHWSILLFGFVGCIIVYKLRGGRVYSLANSVAFLVGVTCKNSLLKFSVADISIYPLVIKGIFLETRRLRSQPNVEIEIGEIKIELRIIEFIKDALAGRTPWIHRDALLEYIMLIEISHMFIYSETMRFRDFLDPPKQRRGAKLKRVDPDGSKDNENVTSKERSMSLSQKIVRMVTIVFKDMNFDFQMPMVDLKIKGGVESMIISPTSARSAPYNLKATTSVRGYYIAIDDKASVDAHEFNMAMNMTAAGDEYYIKNLYAKRSKRKSSTRSSMENITSTSQSYPSSFRKRQSTIFHNIPDNILDTQETIRIDVEIENDTGIQIVNTTMISKHKVFLGVKPFLNFYDKYQTAEDDAIEMKKILNLSTAGKMNYIGVSVDEMDVELIDPKRCGDNLRLEVGKINVVLSKTPCSGETSMTRKYVKSLITNVTYVNWVDFPGAFVDSVDLAIVKNVFNDDPFIDKEVMTGTISEVKFPDTSNQLLHWLLVLQEISDNLPSSRFSNMKDNEINVNIDDMQFRTFPDKCMKNDTHRKNIVMNFRQLCVKIEGKAYAKTKSYKVTSEKFHLTSDMLLDELSEIMRVEVDKKVYHGPGIQGVEYYGTYFDIPNMEVLFEMGGPLFQLIQFTSSKVDIDSFMERYFFDLDGDQVQAPEGVVVSSTQPFLRTSPVIAKWNLKDISADIQECQVYAGFASILKYLQSQNAVLRLIDRILFEMASIKYFPKQPPPKPPPEPSEIAVSITTLNVELLLKDLEDENEKGEASSRNESARSGIDSRFPMSSPGPISSDTNDRNSPLNIFTSPLENRSSIDRATSDSFTSSTSRNVWKQYENNNKRREYIIVFGDFKAVLNGGDSTYSWGIGDIYLNGHSRSWFHSDDFVFSSTKPKLTSSEGSLDRSTPPIPTSQPPGSNKLQDRTMKRLKNPRMELFVGNMELSIIARTDVDDVIQCLLGQFNTWKMASLPHTPLNPVEALTESEPFVFDFHVNTFALHIDAIVVDDNYQKNIISQYMTISFDNLDMFLDSSANSAAVHEKIYSLDDYINCRSLRYFGCAGGELDLTATAMAINLRSSSSAPIVEGHDIELHGPIFVAGVRDDKLMYCEKFSLLDYGNASFSRIGSTLVRSSAPSKIYGSLEFDAKGFDVLVREETAELLSAVTSTISLAFPSKSLDKSPPLQVWDNLNFLLHGNVNFKADRIQTIVELESFSDQSELLQLTLIAESMSVSLTKSNLSFEGYKFSIDAHVKKRIGFTQPIPGNRSFTEADRLDFNRDFYEGDFDTDAVKPRLESRLFYMPKLIMIHEYIPVGTSTVSGHFSTNEENVYYGHHDVYLKPMELMDNSSSFDKFARFRSSRHSVHYRLKITCSDVTNKEPVDIRVRLDILEVILQIAYKLNTNGDPSIVVAKDSPSVKSMNERKSISEIQDGRGMEKIENLSFFDLIDVFEAEFDLANEFIACSWASREDPVGLVVSQQNFYLFMRLKRNVSKPKCPFSIEKLTTIVDDVDLYFREWDTSQLACDVLPDQELFASDSSPEIPCFQPVHIVLGHSEPVHINHVKGLFSPLCRIAHATKVEVDVKGKDHNQGEIMSFEYSERMSGGVGSPMPILSTNSPKRVSKVSPKDEDLEQEKIWDLVVEEIRLLWSVGIRDVVFAYVGHTFRLHKDLKEKRKDKKERKVKSAEAAVVTVERSPENVKNTDSTTAEYSQLALPKENTVNPAQNTTVSYDGNNSRKKGPLSYSDEVELDESSKRLPGVSFPENSALSYTQTAQMALQQSKYTDDIDIISPGPMRRSSAHRKLMKLIKSEYQNQPDVVSNTQISSSSLRRATINQHHSIISPTSLHPLRTSVHRDESDDYANELSCNDHVSHRNLKATEMTKRKSRATIIDSSLWSHRVVSILFINFKLAKKPRAVYICEDFKKNGTDTSTRSKFDRFDDTSNNQVSAGKNPRLSVASSGLSEEVDSGKHRRSRLHTEKHRKHTASSSATMAEFKCYFSVALIHPQINFLDSKSHSCFVIRANKSSLVGLHQKGVPVIINNENKVKNKLELRMEQISLYTAGNLEYIDPDTGLEVDTVLWHLNEGQSNGARPRSPTRDKSHSSFGGFSFSPEISSPLSNPMTGRTNFTSNTQLRNDMKEAVKEFEIDAEYDFFTQYTQEDSSAKAIKHRKSKTLNNKDIRNSFHAPDKKTSASSTADLADETVCCFRLVVPNFEVELDSLQFNIFYNVSRNLLLAPPPLHAQEVMETGKKLAKNQEKGIVIERDSLRSYENGKIDIGRSAIREELKDTLEGYINSGKFLLQRHIGSARSNEILLKKGKWTLKSDNVDLPAPVINFTGLYGSHVFHENGCTSTVLEVQMLNIIQHNAGSDAKECFGELAAENVLCSSDTIAQCVRCNREFDTLRNFDGACVGHFDRFGKKGEWCVIDDSSSSSADEDEEEESFFDSDIDYGHGNEELDEVVHIVVRNRQSRKQRRDKKAEERKREAKKKHERGVWSCCQSTEKFSKGCSKEPHQMRKIMFAMTMDANPSVKIEDTTVPGSPIVDLGVINALSISFYPEDKNEIKVQIASTLSDTLHKYFNINESVRKEILEEKDTENFKQTRNSMIDTDIDQMSLEDNNKKNNKKKKKGIGRFLNPFKRRDAAKKASYSGVDGDDDDSRSVSGFSEDENSTRRGGDNSLYNDSYDGMSITNSSNAVSSLNSSRSKMKSLKIPPQNSNRQLAPSSRLHQHLNDPGVEKNKEKNVQEAVYIKYMRVGEIVVNVSTAGFIINTKGYAACVDPLVLHGKVYDWGRLLLKVEKQAANSVAKHTFIHWMEQIASTVKKTFAGDSKEVENAVDPHQLEHRNSTSINEFSVESPADEGGQHGIHFMNQRNSMNHLNSNSAQAQTFKQKKKKKDQGEEDKYFLLMGVRHGTEEDAKAKALGLR